MRDACIREKLVQFDAEYGSVYQLAKQFGPDMYSKIHTAQGNNENYPLVNEK